MKTYTIIGGVNSVGKSSFTGVLKECSTDLGIIVDADKITAGLGAGSLAGGKAVLKKINEFHPGNNPVRAKDRSHGPVGQGI